MSVSESGQNSWRTATMSGGGNCVQVKAQHGMVIIGNSRLADGPFITYTKDEFAAFLDGAKKGEFDDFVG